MNADQAEQMLTAAERAHLESARKAQREVYGLEDYSRLWDEIDQRLGSENELTRHFVTEYGQISYESPRDHEESVRVDMMRASFYLPRTGMPKDIVRALQMFDIFGRR